jgi:hypothetical protein
MKGLTGESLSGATAAYLTGSERDALLSRRDRIVEFFQDRIREKGEENVVFG